MPPKKKTEPVKKTTTKASRWSSRNATAAAVEKFEDQFGKDMGINLKTSKPRRPKITTTGSMNLDYALTIGGVPDGRIVEAWGPEHAGKTTLAIIQCVQKQREHPNKRVAWVDMEQTFDEDWAVQLGLDMSKVWFYTPESAEDVADATKRFVSSGLCSIVVLDSVGGMISRIEQEKEADEATVGLVPKIVTRMVLACSPMAGANGTTLYVINQVRAKIGGFGPDEDTSGGWALKHTTTIKMQVRRAGGDAHMVKFPGEEKPTPVGHKIAVRIQKNKMGPYGQVAEIWLHNRPTDKYGPVGIDPIPEIFDFAKRYRLMGEKGGGYYAMPSGVEVRSEEKVIEHLRLHPEDAQALRTQILDQIKDRVEEEDPEEQDDPMGIADMVDSK